MVYELKRAIRASELSQAIDMAFTGDDRLIKGVAALRASREDYATFSKELSLSAPGSIVFCPITVPPDPDSRTVFETSSPKLDFIRALEFLVQACGIAGRDTPAKISPTARLGSNVVVCDGCEIGEHVVIEANCVIHSGTKIGAHSRVRSNTSIGSDGFGFERLPDKTPIRFPHLGGVQIGQHVEIGSCSAIARGTLQDTIIEDHVKIDNLVHVGHNCVVRRGAFLIAGVVLGGSVEVGENAWVSLNACVREKLKIGQGATLGMGSVMVRSVKPEDTVFGVPAEPLWARMKRRKSGT